MAASPIAKKLLIKPGSKGTLINVPNGYDNFQGEMPPGIELVRKATGALDFVILFVKDKAEFDKNLAGAIKAVKQDGLLWVCYPKGTSKIKTDVNRDIIWKEALKYNFTGVAMISIDETWSAMRFRPADKVDK